MGSGGRAKKRKPRFWWLLFVGIWWNVRPADRDGLLRGAAGGNQTLDNNSNMGSRYAYDGYD